MSIQIGKTYLKKYFVETIYSQVKSEGISATFIDSKQILEGRTDSSLVKYSEKMVIISLKRVWEYIIDNLGVDFYFENLCLLNAIVSDDTNNKPGVIRTEIVGENDKRYYPKFVDEFQVRDSMHLINKINNPLKRAIEIFLYLSKTQVFENCNKRTSFLMANKILIENGFGILHPPLNTELDRKYKLDLVNYYFKDDEYSIKITLLTCCYNSMEVDKYKYLNNTDCIFLKDYKEIDENIYKYLSDENLI